MKFGTSGIKQILHYRGWQISAAVISDTLNR